MIKFPKLADNNNKTYEKPVKINQNSNLHGLAKFGANKGSDQASQPSATPNHPKTL